MNAYAVVYRNEGKLAKLLELAAKVHEDMTGKPNAMAETMRAAAAALSQPYTLHTLCKTPECAVESISPFEGAEVFGMATIAVESEPVSGLRYRVRVMGERRGVSGLASAGIDGCQLALQTCHDALMKFAAQPLDSSPPWDDLTKALREAADALAATNLRNMPDGATLEEYRDQLAVGNLTALDQMAFDNVLHDFLESQPTLREAAAAGITDRQRRMRGTNPGSAYDDPRYTITDAGKAMLEGE